MYNNLHNLSYNYFRIIILYKMKTTIIKCFNILQKHTFIMCVNKYYKVKTIYYLIILLLLI